MLHVPWLQCLPPGPVHAPRVSSCVGLWGSAVADCRRGRHGYAAECHVRSGLRGHVTGWCGRGVANTYTGCRASFQAPPSITVPAAHIPHELSSPTNPQRLSRTSPVYP